MPSVVSGGPAATMAYIRELRREPGLLDTVWAEGGILLDAKTHTLLFFGGLAIYTSPYLRCLFLPAVQPIWQGWTVAWAAHGVVDLAAYPCAAHTLGITPTSVIRADVSVWDPYPRPEIDDPDNPYYAASGDTPDEPAAIGTILTVRWEVGQIADYSLWRFPWGYLTFGVGRLDILRKRTSEPLPREDHTTTDGYDLVGGGYADVQTQTLWVWENHTLNPAYLERIAWAWPGWQVKENLDGLAHQVTLSGRDPMLVTVPQDKVIEEIIKELANDASFDPVAFAQTTLAGATPGTNTFAPGFFQMNQPAVAGSQLREVFMRLLHSEGPAPASDDDGEQDASADASADAGVNDNAPHPDR
ncbi:MAG: hypothetical protein ABI068_18105 [Ktedonobacterales bacterium]